MARACSHIFVITLNIMRRKIGSHIIISSVKDIKNYPTEEYVGLSFTFKIVNCLTGQYLKSKYVVCYVLATLVLYTVTFFVPFDPEGVF